MKRLISVVLILICFVLSGCAVDLSDARIGFGMKRAVVTEVVTAEIALSEEYLKGYFYDEALGVISGSEHAGDERMLAQAEKINAEKARLVPYDGQIYHVFFHSLIIYPELAFDGDYKHEGYDMWMTTVSEFKAMLPQLYERGFILYSLNEIKENTPIYLPEGKKPLIISIDDVNYYDYMKGDGFAKRLVVNDKGDVVTEVETPGGETVLTYDGDVMPILDEFVKEHPDFSYRGAKGIVAVTGYEGAFGYRITDLEGEELKAAQGEVKRISEIMKKNGWLFACHSYTHNDYFRDGSVKYDILAYDTGRWMNTINEYVLEPDIYISPFGYHLKPGEARLKYLKETGFTYFCPVSTSMRTLYTEDGTVISERFNLDRYNMRVRKEYINQTFFDVDSVYYNIGEGV